MDELFESVELESQKKMTDEELALMLRRDGSILKELQRMASEGKTSSGITITNSGPGKTEEETKSGATGTAKQSGVEVNASKPVTGSDIETADEEEDEELDTYQNHGDVRPRQLSQSRLKTNQRITSSSSTSTKTMVSPSKKLKPSNPQRTTESKKTDSPSSSSSSSPSRCPPASRGTHKTPVVLANGPTMDWTEGEVFVIPRGRDMSLNLKKTLEEKFVTIGGKTSASANQAKFIVVSPELATDMIRKDYLKSSLEGKQIVTVDWLRTVIARSKFVNPAENAAKFMWKEPRRTQRDFAGTGFELQRDLSSSSSSDRPRTVNDIPERYRLAAKAMDLLPTSSSASQAFSQGEEEVSTPLDAYSTNPPKLSALTSKPAVSVSQTKAATHGHAGQLYLKDRAIPKDKLACQKLPQPGSASSETLNATLIAELSKMADLNAAKGDTWRSKSYSQAVAIIRTLDFQVTDSNQIRHRKGIGARMAQHIDEVLSTGKLAKRVAFENDPMNKALLNLKNIYGVGEEWAMKLYKLGFHDIESIRRGVATGDLRLQLSKNQLIGVKYYEDLQQRLKRTEMESIVSIVKNAARDVYGGEQAIPDLVVEIVGSYRRGKESSGDIDIILTSPSHLKERLSLVPLIHHLQNKSKLITDVLTISVDLRARKMEIDSLGSDGLLPEPAKEASGFFVPPANESEPESETFMGICLLPAELPGATGVHRRIDIKSYPAETFAFALLYFTGSAHFNRSMRYYAKNSGYSLSDKGLYPCTRFSKDRVLKGASVQCRTEEDIFNALGLEYRAPKDRNCDEIVVVSEVQNAAGVAGDAEDDDDVDFDAEDQTIAGEGDDDDQRLRESSDDDEDQVAISGLPAHFLSSTETIEMFLSRCAPSSFKVRSPWIRIWNEPSFYGNEEGDDAVSLPLARFDELDDARNLRPIRSLMMLNASAGTSSSSADNPAGPLAFREVVDMCVQTGCLSGKWTLRARREEVDAVWGRICKTIASGKAPICVTGAKVNSIAFRKRKHNLSVISVYTQDFRDVTEIRQALAMLRTEANVVGTLHYRSEAVSAAWKRNVIVYVSTEGAEMEAVT